MKNLYKVLLVIALGSFSLQVKAVPIDIALTSADCVSGSCWTTNDSSNLTIAEVTSLIGYSGTLVELYKQNVGDAFDSGSSASSYMTTFSNSTNDPSDALIEYVSGAPISCPDCFLLIKDGNQQPAQYVFDIGTWDGLGDLDMTGFWPNQGAISHVTIFGAIASVPEPGMIGLLAIGIIGVVVARRRVVA